jgi:hypothetical protein
MAHPGMPPIRSLAVALILASLVSACGSEGLECPATGAPLLAGVPELQSEWGPGCIDSSSWTADVDPANATWTIELRRQANVTSSLVVEPLVEGVAVVWGGELILLDGEGHETRTRALGTAAQWSSFVATPDGQMIVADQAGGTPEYRVLSPTGADIWLRLLAVDMPVSNRPTLALADDGSLWVGMSRFTPDFQDIELSIQQWAVTGGMQSEVVLPGVKGREFARDDAGRFAVIDQGLELFEADGTAIAAIGFGSSSFVVQVLGLADGFVVGGGTNDVSMIARIDGQGEIVWQRTLEVGRAESSYVSALARLPDGGVVAVGSDSTIAVRYPDSPFVEREQPFVIALDDAGVPTWGERLAAGGRSSAVTIGSQGEVYVVGTAQAEPSEYGQVDEIVWLRRYDP